MRSRSGTARVVIASAAAVLPRVTTPDGLLAASLVAEARSGHLAGRSRRAAGRRRLHARRSRRRARASSRSAAASPTSFQPVDTLPVRLEFIGDTIETLRTYDPSTQRSIAPIDQMSIVPLRDVLQDNRGATIFDYLTRASASRIIVSERDEVDANVDEAARRRSSRATRTFTETSPPATVTGPCRRPADAVRRLATPWRRGSRTRRLLSILGVDAGLSRDSMPAGGRAQRPRRRLGRRDPAAARRWRDDAVRGGDAGPRRAHDRAAQGIRRLRDTGGARRGRALRRGARRGRRAVARLPPSRRRPPDLRRGGRLRGGAPRARAAPLGDARRSSRICAISRSATSSCTSTTASACSSA